MGIFSRFLPKRKPVEIKNNVPKEKEEIRKTFGVYCHSHHNTSGSKLCPKCTALLTTVMTKISRCPYGITKPICERCDRPCFGTKQTKEFRSIMQSTQKKMFLRHPILAFKHKMKRGKSNRPIGMTFYKIMDHGNNNPSSGIGVRKRKNNSQIFSALQYTQQIPELPFCIFPV